MIGCLKRQLSSPAEGRPEKPLTEEQKEERKERLAAARAKRAPSTHKSVHPDVPRDPVHPWNVDNIKRWIKTNQDELSSLKSQVKKDFDRSKTID